MATKRSPLTETAVRNAKPRARPYRISDRRNFYLLVRPTGAKCWRWKYSYRGLEKLMTFGQYPDVSLEKARKRAQDARTLLADGIDPMALRKEQREALQTQDEALREQRRNTFSHVAKDWHAHWKINQTERHARYVWSRLQNDILPSLGSSPIAQIQALDVIKMLRAISDRGVADLAKRALQVSKSVFSYAVTHQVVQHSPVAHLKPNGILPKTVKQNYARVDAKELPKLLHAIDGYQGEPTRLAMQLLAHTFVRTSELIAPHGTRSTSTNGAGTFQRRE